MRINKRGNIRITLDSLIEQYNLDEYTDKTINVELGWSVGETLIREVSIFRSPLRIAKQPHLKLGSVHLMIDYHSGEYSIELKPKYSCALEFATTPPSFHSKLHHHLCRFCNHNYSLQETIDNTENRYCPSLLFSSDHNNIKTCIEWLFKSPAKYLHCFHYGERIEPAYLPPTHVSRLVNLVQNGELISLKNALYMTWQKILKSPDTSQISNDDLQIAVVLRDCSIIFQFPEEDRKPIIKLIDLDAKPQNKLALYYNEIIEMKQALYENKYG